MTKKQKKMLIRIITGAVLFTIAMILTHTVLVLPWWGELLVYAAIYLISGTDPLKKAAVNIAHGQVFDENFLMCLATIGAFAIGEYPEAVEVILFYQVGSLFESIAVGRSRKAVSDLMDICPDEAVVLRDGERVTVETDEVEVGEHILVAPGERFPLDGTICKGTTNIDTSALTGESVPVSAAPDTEVMSGCINLTGAVEVIVTKPADESTAAKILELVEQSAEHKAKAENFITKFARYYTPCVVIAALILAVVPPLFTGFHFSEWIFRALTFLIVSCPCALVISVPLSFFGGIGAASKQGILIKGSNYLEVLAKAKTVVMDKTGTLTKGTFTVTEIYPVNTTEQELLQYAAYAESESGHPIAKSLRQAFGADIDRSRIEQVQEQAGHGVSAIIDGKAVLAGKKSYLEAAGVVCSEENPAAAGTVVYVSVAGEYKGYLVISDTIKEDSPQAIAGLRKAGVTKTVMLTGDRKQAGEAIAKQLGLDAVYTELLPADKVSHMQAFREELQEKGSLVFVGDGMNDAPVLAQSDVGVAMGGLGSDAAVEAADIVLMDDKPSKLVLAIRIARKTLGIARQNIVFALAVKALVLLLGVFGMVSMELAVFADVGVSVIAILNAMRTLRMR